MDLEPVAPGLAPAAALLARGAEPNVEMQPAHSLVQCARQALAARPAPAGPNFHVCESSIANVLDDVFHYTAPAVGNIDTENTARYLLR